MGTPGRKRNPVRETFAAEDDALGHIAKEAEARLAAKRAARAEAREIRLRELEKQQKESLNGDCASRHDPWYTQHVLRSGPPSRRGSVSDQVTGTSRRSSSLSRYDDASAFELAGLDDPADNEPMEGTAKSVTRSSVSSLSSVSLGSQSSSTSKQTSVEMSPGDDVLIKESLRDVEEKYKVAMMSNAQLDNEKANLIYQVDTLRDTLEELEEQMAELRREHGDKCKELERQKHDNSVLKFKFDEVHEALKQRDELIEEIGKLQSKEELRVQEINELNETIEWKEKKIGRHGLVLVPETEPDAGNSGAPEGHGSLALVSREAAEVLNTVGDGPLDVRLKKLAEDKDNLLEEVRSLKEQLEEVKQKSSDSNMDLAENGVEILETHRDVNRQLNDCKFKLSKAEQDIIALEQSVARLESQVARYKTASENAEKVEDELKADKRKLQRELRSVQDRVEELEITNSQLNKRMEKMRANRNLAATQD
uniref:Leucine rich repeat (in FLII) interacting protein 2 n=1 Tax=Eptatretus burgeri TaxID=7764 RepID=A0A8C4QC87_EPTBU